MVREGKDNRFSRKIEERPISSLPPGDVLVKVRYSSLNDKDVLSAIGNRGVTKDYPHTPGIDAAGVVEESSNPGFRPGDPVIVTSYDLGMNTPGGYGQYIRVPAGWVVKLPRNLTLRESMIYGTAGYTAALSVHRLVECGIKPDQGTVLVSGATGVVGSIAVSLLVKARYQVAAVNGVVDETAYLLALGSKEVISIEEATDTSGRPLLKARRAGAVDTIGGVMLSTTIRSLQYGGAVKCCGNVGSHDLPLNVYPFIIRGAVLIGIDSQKCPMPLRQAVWERVAGEWKLDHLDQITTETTLEGLSEKIDMVLEKKHRGRTIVRLPE